jgi:hypothetical protein
MALAEHQSITFLLAGDDFNIAEKAHALHRPDRSQRSHSSRAPRINPCGAMVMRNAH